LDRAQMAEIFVAAMASNTSSVLRNPLEIDD
jgi:hypothetical protein